LLFGDHARRQGLRWLVDGRQDPNCYIGYVFLYFYGLERRLLVDGRASPAAAAERESLLAEVRRLDIASEADSETIRR